MPIALKSYCPWDTPAVWLCNSFGDFRCRKETAKEIGREPVQYVSNIYKYYVSYRLAVEQEERKRAKKRVIQPAKGGITP
jgi:hypothetical protein